MEKYNPISIKIVDKLKLNVCLCRQIGRSRTNIIILPVSEYRRSVLPLM